MLHHALGGALGNASDLRHSADILAGFSDILAQEYARKSGRSLAEITAMMDAETWLWGSEIVEAGLADELVPVADTGKIKVLQPYRASAIQTAQIQYAACAQTTKANLGNDVKRVATLVGDRVPGLTDQDVKFLKAAGMSLAEIREFAPRVGNR